MNNLELFTRVPKTEVCLEEWGSMSVGQRLGTSWSPGEHSEQGCPRLRASIDAKTCSEAVGGRGTLCGGEFGQPPWIVVSRDAPKSLTMSLLPQSVRALGEREVIGHLCERLVAEAIIKGRRGRDLLAASTTEQKLSLVTLDELRALLRKWRIATEIHAVAAVPPVSVDSLPEGSPWRIAANIPKRPLVRQLLDHMAAWSARRAELLTTRDVDIGPVGPRGRDGAVVPDAIELAGATSTGNRVVGGYSPPKDLSDPLLAMLISAPPGMVRIESSSSSPLRRGSRRASAEAVALYGRGDPPPEVSTTVSSGRKVHHEWLEQSTGPTTLAVAPPGTKDFGGTLVLLSRHAAAHPNPSEGEMNVSAPVLISSKVIRAKRHSIPGGAVTVGEGTRDMMTSKARQELFDLATRQGVEDIEDHDYGEAHPAGGKVVEAARSHQPFSKASTASKPTQHHRQLRVPVTESKISLGSSSGNNHSSSTLKALRRIDSASQRSLQPPPEHPRSTPRRRPKSKSPSNSTQKPTSGSGKKKPQDAPMTDAERRLHVKRAYARKERRASVSRANAMAQADVVSPLDVERSKRASAAVDMALFAMLGPEGGVTEGTDHAVGFTHSDDDENLLQALEGMKRDPEDEFVHGFSRGAYLQGTGLQDEHVIDKFKERIGHAGTAGQRRASQDLVPDAYDGGASSVASGERRRRRRRSESGDSRGILTDEERKRGFPFDGHLPGFEGYESSEMSFTGLSDADTEASDDPGMAVLGGSFYRKQAELSAESVSMIPVRADRNDPQRRLFIESVLKGQERSERFEQTRRDRKGKPLSELEEAAAALDGSLHVLPQQGYPDEAATMSPKKGSSTLFDMPQNEEETDALWIVSKAAPKAPVASAARHEFRLNMLKAQIHHAARPPSSTRSNGSSSRGFRSRSSKHSGREEDHEDPVTLAAMAGEVLFKARSFRDTGVRIPASVPVGSLDDTHIPARKVANLLPVAENHELELDETRASVVDSETEGSAKGELELPSDLNWLQGLETAELGDDEESKTQQKSLRQQCARALRDLSKQPANRLRILMQGAHNALVTVLEDSKSHSTRLDCAVGLANLSALQPSLPYMSSAAAKRRGVAMFPTAPAAASVRQEQGSEEEAGFVLKRPGFSPNPLQDMGGTPIGALASTVVVPAFTTATNLTPAPGVALSLTDLIRASESTLLGNGRESVASELGRKQHLAENSRLLSLRATSSVALFNHTVALEARQRMALEMAAETLAEMMKPQILNNMDQNLRTLTSGSRPWESTIGPLSPETLMWRATNSVTMQQVSTDAVILSCAVAGLANMAAAPGAGRSSVLTSSVLSTIRSNWYVYPPAVRAVLASRVVEPLTRPLSTINRLATAGSVVLLVDAIRFAYASLFPVLQRRLSSLNDANWGQEAVKRARQAGLVSTPPSASMASVAGETLLDQVQGPLFVIRRSLRALSRLSLTRQSAQKIARSYGGRALAEAIVVVALFASSEAEEMVVPSRARSPFSSRESDITSPLPGKSLHIKTGRDDPLSGSKTPDATEAARPRSSTGERKAASKVATMLDRASRQLDLTEDVAQAQFTEPGGCLASTRLLRKGAATMARLSTALDAPIGWIHGVGTGASILLERCGPLIGSDPGSRRAVRLTLFSLCNALGASPREDQTLWIPASESGSSEVNRELVEERPREIQQTADAVVEYLWASGCVASIVRFSLLADWGTPGAVDPDDCVLDGPPPRTANSPSRAESAESHPSSPASSSHEAANWGDGVIQHTFDCDPLAVLAAACLLNVCRNPRMVATVGQSGAPVPRIPGPRQAVTIPEEEFHSLKPAQAQYVGPKSMEDAMKSEGPPWLSEESIGCRKGDIVVALIHLLNAALDTLQRSTPEQRSAATAMSLEAAVTRASRRIGILADGSLTSPVCPRATCVASYCMAALRYLVTDGTADTSELRRMLVVTPSALGTVLRILKPRKSDPFSIISKGFGDTPLIPSRKPAQPPGRRSMTTGPRAAASNKSASRPLSAHVQDKPDAASPKRVTEPSVEVSPVSKMRSAWNRISEHVSPRLRRASMSDDQLPPLPLPIIADAVAIVSSLSAESFSRRIVAEAGAVPALVPIAAKAPMSSLAVSRALTLRMLRLRHEDWERIERERHPGAAVPAALKQGGRRPSVGAASVTLIGSAAAEVVRRLSTRGGPAYRNRAPSPLGSPAEHQPSIVSTPSQGSPVMLISPVAKSRLRHDELERVKEEAERARAPESGVANLPGDVNPVLLAEQRRIERLAIAVREECAVGLTHLATDLATEPAGEDSTSPRAPGGAASNENKAAVSFRAGILRALRALAEFGGDQASTRVHVARALRMLAGSPGVGREMVAEGLLPVIMSLSASRRAPVRRECAGAFFSLSAEADCAKAMVEEGVVGTLAAMALVRCRDATSQVLCVLTLHNLMAHPSLRWAVLNTQVDEDEMAASSDQGAQRSATMWTLQKLCLSENIAVQRACAMTLRKLADGFATRQVLVNEGGLRSVVRILARDRGRADEEISSPVTPLPSPRRSPLERISRSSNSSRGLGGMPEVLTTDPLVGSWLAGVLGTVSREPGHEDALVKEGAIEALVLLAGSGMASRAQHSAQDLDREKDADLELRAACALGLCNLAASPDDNVRLRVVQGGAVGVFVGLGSNPLHGAHGDTRALSLLGLCHVLWSANPTMQRSVLNEGAARVFAEVAIDDTDPGHAYAAVVCLHMCSSSRALIAPMIADGGVTALTSVLKRACDASPTELLGIGTDNVLMADSVAVAFGAVANLGLSTRGKKALSMSAKARAEVEQRRSAAVVQQAQTALRKGETPSFGLWSALSNSAPSLDEPDGGLWQATRVPGSCLAAALGACIAVCGALNAAESMRDKSAADSDTLEILKVTIDECSALILEFSRHDVLRRTLLGSRGVAAITALLHCRLATARASTRAAAAARNLSCMDEAREYMLEPVELVNASQEDGSVETTSVRLVDMLVHIASHPLDEFGMPVADRGMSDNGSLAGPGTEPDRPTSSAETVTSERVKEEDDSLDVFLDFADDILEGKKVQGLDATMPENPQVSGFKVQSRISQGGPLDVRSKAGRMGAGSAASDALFSMPPSTPGSKATGAGGLAAASHNGADSPRSYGVRPPAGKRLSSVFFSAQHGPVEPPSTRVQHYRRDLSSAGGRAKFWADAESRAEASANAARERERKDLERRIRISHFLRRKDAAKVLCNLSREYGAHEALKSAGAAGALLRVSDDALCGEELRTACLRGLCELSIEREQEPAKEEQELRAGSPGTQSTSAMRVDWQQPTTAEHDVVSAGAVSALLAMMANREEPADEIPVTGSMDTVPTFGVLDSDEALCHPNTRAASLSHPALFANASRRIHAPLPDMELAQAVQSSLTGEFKERLLEHAAVRERTIAQMMANSPPNATSPSLVALSSSLAMDRAGPGEDSLPPPPSLMASMVRMVGEDGSPSKELVPLGPRGTRWSVGYDVVDAQAITKEVKLDRVTVSRKGRNNSPSRSRRQPVAVMTSRPPPVVAAALGLRVFTNGEPSQPAENSQDQVGELEEWTLVNRPEEIGGWSLGSLTLEHDDGAAASASLHRSLHSVSGAQLQEQARPAIPPPTAMVSLPFLITRQQMISHSSLSQHSLLRNLDNIAHRATPANGAVAGAASNASQALAESRSKLDAWLQRLPNRALLLRDAVGSDSESVEGIHEREEPTQRPGREADKRRAGRKPSSAQLVSQPSSERPAKAFTAHETLYHVATIAIGLLQDAADAAEASLEDSDAEEEVMIASLYAAAPRQAGDAVVNTVAMLRRSSAMNKGGGPLLAGPSQGSSGGDSLQGASSRRRSIESASLYRSADGEGVAFPLIAEPATVHALIALNSGSSQCFVIDCLRKALDSPAPLLVPSPPPSRRISRSLENSVPPRAPVRPPSRAASVQRGSNNEAHVDVVSLKMLLGETQPTASFQSMQWVPGHRSDGVSTGKDRESVVKTLFNPMRDRFDEPWLTDMWGSLVRTQGMNDGLEPDAHLAARISLMGALQMLPSQRSLRVGIHETPRITAAAVIERALIAFNMFDIASELDEPSAITASPQPAVEALSPTEESASPGTLVHPPACLAPSPPRRHSPPVIRHQPVPRLSLGTPRATGHEEQHPASPHHIPRQPSTLTLSSEEVRDAGGACVVALATAPDGTSREVKVWPGEAGYAQLAHELFLQSLEDPSHRDEDGFKRSTFASLRPSTGTQPPTLAAIASPRAPGVAQELREQFESKLQGLDPALAQRAREQAMRGNWAAPPGALVHKSFAAVYSVPSSKDEEPVPDVRHPALQQMRREQLLSAYGRRGPKEEAAEEEAMAVVPKDAEHRVAKHRSEATSLVRAQGLCPPNPVGGQLFLPFHRLPVESRPHTSGKPTKRSHLAQLGRATALGSAREGDSLLATFKRNRAKSPYNKKRANKSSSRAAEVPEAKESVPVVTEAVRSRMHENPLPAWAIPGGRTAPGMPASGRVFFPKTTLTE
jgi:hypothetical protein